MHLVGFLIRITIISPMLWAFCDVNNKIIRWAVTGSYMFGNNIHRPNPSYTLCMNWGSQQRQAMYVQPNTLRTGLLNCLNALSRGLPLGTVRPVYRDRRFATLQEDAFYRFNQQIYFIISYLLDRASLIFRKPTRCNNNGLLIIPVSSTCFGKLFYPSSGALHFVLQFVV